MDSRRVQAFGILGIPPDSDQAAVAHAYRRLARATHPDVSEDPEAAHRFAAVAAAYRLASEEPRTTAIPVRVHKPAPNESIFGKRRPLRAPIVAGPVWVDPPHRHGGP